jgi:replicative DNA helicase
VKPQRNEQKIEALREPPRSIEAEQSVLGGMMLTPAAYDLVADLIREDDFFSRKHRVLFRAIVDLAEKGLPFDAVTIGEWLMTKDMDDMVGGASYVVELANATPSAANIKAYAAIVREKAILRRIINASMEAAARAFEPDATPALLDDVIANLMAVQGGNETAEVTLRAAEHAAWDDARAAYDRGGAIAGITTGLVDMDDITGGWHDSDLNIVGGRPGMGKTAALVGCVMAAARSGKRVGVISAEMSAPQFGVRSLASSAQVAGRGFRTGQFEDEEWSRILKAITANNSLPVTILDRSRPSIYEVARTARRWKKQGRLDVLFVDYIQRLTARGEKRNERIGEIAVGLKTIARDLNIPVIALSQVNREVERRTNKVPTMSDLSDSSELEKEADSVALLYRHGYYEPDCKEPNRVEIHFDKNRHGPVGSLEVLWLPASMAFVNYLSPP